MAGCGDIAVGGDLCAAAIMGAMPLLYLKHTKHVIPIAQTTAGPAMDNVIIRVFCELPEN